MIARVAQFMAVWMMFLALVPCADGETAEHLHGGHAHSDCAAAVSQHHDSIEAIHHTEHGANDEHCSPLCHCGCCHTSIVFFQMDLIPDLAAPHTSRQFSLENQLCSSYTQTIWQPPKI